MNIPLSTLVRRAALGVAAASLCLAPALRASPVPERQSLGGWELQDAAKVPQGGETVAVVGYPTQGWHRAAVPGTVLTSLVNDGTYPEPLYGENNRPDRIPDSLCRTSYWYRTQFTVPGSYAGTHVWLNLKGINYTAEVWVNGHDVGTVKGAFARGVFDITPLVEAGKAAALAVHVFPPPHPGVPNEKTVQFGTGPNGGILSEDGATFLCTMGWDWIPGIRDRDIGLWQGVELSSTGPVVLRDPLVNSDLRLPQADRADLAVQASLRNVSGAPQSGILRGSFGDVSFEYPVTLQAGESRTIRLTPSELPQLRVSHPLLWWPNGYGPQNLYVMRLSFDVADGASDAKEVTFGIRKYTYEVADSPNLTISVNGVRVMCKGGAWGMDEAMKRIPRERLDAQVRFHQLAHYNMIRNWVGQSTSDDFYDLCDKYGIMVWDEFFQPNKADGPNVVDIPTYLDNVREKILRYRSHPSIAIWCGRNESDPAPEEVDVGIQKIAAELDPARLYHRNSADGRGVRSAGPYFWREPREFYKVDTAFKTETGSVSVPTIESVHAMLPQKDWESVDDAWAEHDLCHGAQEASRPGQLYPDIIATRYGTVANLPDFVRKAQLANYEAFRAMYEGRFAELFKPCTGVLTWMSNAAQPSFVWQIYSYELEPLSSFFAVRKACEPVHVQMNESNFHVMVINNTSARLSGLSAWVRVFNMDGTLKLENRIPVNAAETAATDLGAIAFPEGLSPVHFVKLVLVDAAGAAVSDNFYWRASPDHPDRLSPLEGMPTVPLRAEIACRNTGGKCLLDVTLTNPTRSVALMAHVQLRRKATQERVLPAYYSDNYVSLLPGESRTISVEAAAKDLGGEQPALVLDGWNVSLGGGTGGALSIALNEEAQVGSVPTGHWTVQHPQVSLTKGN